MTTLKIVCPCWWFNIGPAILCVVAMSRVSCHDTGNMSCYSRFCLKADIKILFVFFLRTVISSNLSDVAEYWCLLTCFSTFVVQSEIYAVFHH